MEQNEMKQKFHLCNCSVMSTCCFQGQLKTHTHSSECSHDSSDLSLFLKCEQKRFVILLLTCHQLYRHFRVPPAIVVITRQCQCITMLMSSVKNFALERTHCNNASCQMFTNDTVVFTPSCVATVWLQEEKLQYPM